jgi:hypothetical protein
MRPAVPPWSCASRRWSFRGIVGLLPIVHRLLQAVQGLMHAGDARARFHQRPLRSPEHVHGVIETFLDLRNIASKPRPFR